MAEYIDKSNIYSAIAQREEEYRSCLLREKNYNTASALQLQGLLNATTLIKHLIFDFPAAYVRPVVRGKWVKPIRVPDSMLAECSVCGFDLGAYTFNFCPNCGADMREAKA